jgi:transcriptional regulator with XRE-family HTH domain
MEFHDKLQELRKQKGMTQEELAKELHVSRTAVSKWESGRGYPNIDSLKAIANVFSVTVDALLSGEELLTAAEQTQKGSRDLVFGLLDLCGVLLLFLPFFAEKAGGDIREVSLLALSGAWIYLRAAYWVSVVSLILIGVLTLALQNCGNTLWLRCKNNLSVAINTLGVLLFIISQQPYAASFLFVFLMIKVILLNKKR